MSVVGLGWRGGTGTCSSSGSPANFRLPCHDKKGQEEGSSGKQETRGNADNNKGGLRYLLLRNRRGFQFFIEVINVLFDLFDLPINEKIDPRSILLTRFLLLH